MKKKIILGTSDAWSMSRSFQRPSVLYRQLSDFRTQQLSKKTINLLEKYLPLLSEPFDCRYLRLNQSLLTKQIQYSHVVLQVDLYEGAINFHQLSHKLFSDCFQILYLLFEHTK